MRKVDDDGLAGLTDPYAIPIADIPGVLEKLAALTSALTTRLITERTPAIPTPIPLLTAREASEHLKVKESWVRDKARAGLIPFTRLGAYMRFRREDLETLARNGCE